MSTASSSGSTAVINLDGPVWEPAAILGANAARPLGSDDAKGAG